MIKLNARLTSSVGGAQLASTMNRVSEDGAGEPDVVMPAHDNCKAIEETTSLLGSPANAQRLLSSIANLNSLGGHKSDLLPCD